MFPRPENLHHAYVVEGEKQIIQKDILSFLEEDVHIKIAGNPDVWVFDGTALGIEETRVLREWVLRKAMGERKYALLFFSSATTEAQNALLKTLEEPAGDTVIIVAVPSTDTLLPTILSRAEIIKTSSKRDFVFATEFLSKPSSERFDLIEEVVKEKKTEDALQILDEIETVLAKELKEKQDVDVQEALQEVFLARAHLRGRSPSVKMVMEHLSLVLPQVK